MHSLKTSGQGTCKASWIHEEDALFRKFNEMPHHSISADETNSGEKNAIDNEIIDYNRARDI